MKMSVFGSEIAVSFILKEKRGGVIKLSFNIFCIFLCNLAWLSSAEHFFLDFILQRALTLAEFEGEYEKPYFLHTI